MTRERYESRMEGESAVVIDRQEGGMIRRESLLSADILADALNGGMVEFDSYPYESVPESTDSGREDER